MHSRRETLYVLEDRLLPARSCGTECPTSELKGRGPGSESHDSHSHRHQRSSEQTSQDKSQFSVSKSAGQYYHQHHQHHHQQREPCVIQYRTSIGEHVEIQFYPATQSAIREVAQARIQRPVPSNSSESPLSRSASSHRSHRQSANCNDDAEDQDEDNDDSDYAFKLSPTSVYPARASASSRKSNDRSRSRKPTGRASLMSSMSSPDTYSKAPSFQWDRRYISHGEPHNPKHYLRPGHPHSHHHGSAITSITDSLASTHLQDRRLDSGLAASPAFAPYTSVHVLMLTWDYHDLPGLEDETSRLHSVFSALGYRVRSFRIPLHGAVAKTHSAVRRFVRRHEGDPRSLLVVYYNGHGALVRGELVFQSHHPPAPYADVLGVLPARVPWSAIRDLLWDAHAPMLLLLDCCHGGGADLAHADWRPTPAAAAFPKHVIAACGFEAETPVGTLTPALCAVLHDWVQASMRARARRGAGDRGDPDVGTRPLTAEELCERAKALLQRVVAECGAAQPVFWRAVKGVPEGRVWLPFLEGRKGEDEEQRDRSRSRSRVRSKSRRRSRSRVEVRSRSLAERLTL